MLHPLGTEHFVIYGERNEFSGTEKNVQKESKTLGFVKTRADLSLPFNIVFLCIYVLERFSHKLE
jgi:hypothetical protein